MSIFLIAVGAILAWGVEASLGGVELNTIGWIVMVVGVIGLLVAVLTMSAMPWRRERHDERVIVDRR